MRRQRTRIREGFRRFGILTGVVTLGVWLVGTIYNYQTEQLNSTLGYVRLLLGFLLAYLLPYGLIRALGWAIEGFFKTDAD